MDHMVQCPDAGNDGIYPTGNRALDRGQISKARADGLLQPRVHRSPNLARPKLRANISLAHFLRNVFRENTVKHPVRSEAKLPVNVPSLSFGGKGTLP